MLAGFWPPPPASTSPASTTSLIQAAVNPSLRSWGSGISGINGSKSSCRSSRRGASGPSPYRAINALRASRFHIYGTRRRAECCQLAGVVAPPGIDAKQRATLTSLVDRMQRSAPWKQVLTRNHWIDMFQSGPAFDGFLKQEHVRATGVLKSIGLVK